MDVVAIFRAGRYALTSDGTVCPFVKLFDIEGDPVEDVLDAVEGVAAYSEDLWLSVDLTQFETVKVN